MLTDYNSENALLSSLIQHGAESYHEISTLGVEEHTFSNSSNKIIYKCLEHLFESDNVLDIDVPLVVNAGYSLGYGDWIANDDIKDYLEELRTNSVQKDNTRRFAQKLRKLEVANNISKAVEEIQDEVSKITGDERLADIFGIAESKLSNLAGFLTDTSEDPVNIGKKVRQHIDDLINNPVDQLGIPTGFDIFDKYIGGGLRRHAVTVIGARMKVGKSTLCKNIAQNVAAQGIPVLILDTEMDTEDQMNRLLASVADISLTDIETGKFAQENANKNKIESALRQIESENIYHKKVPGMSIEAQLAVARKWIIRNVGLQKDGRAKECLIVYDYVKILDQKQMGNLQEYQALGFLMTALQNFAVKYDIPILTAAQLNRDGIDKENTAAIGGSDRIAMYGSSISFLKWKSAEELESENHQFGNQKLISVISRYGPAMEEGDYINISFNTDKSVMSEKGTRADSQGIKPNKAAKSAKKMVKTEQAYIEF